MSDIEIFLHPRKKVKLLKLANQCMNTRAKLPHIMLKIELNGKCQMVTRSYLYQHIKLLCLYTKNTCQTIPYVSQIRSSPNFLNINSTTCNRYFLLVSCNSCNQCICLFKISFVCLFHQFQIPGGTPSHYGFTGESSRFEGLTRSYQMAPFKKITLH